MPLDDPSILALEAWDLISRRLFNCLGAQRIPGDRTSTVAHVPIDQMRLSDVARCNPADILRAPNLGRGCFREMWLVLEHYGFSMDGSSASADRWQAMWPGGKDMWTAKWGAERDQRRATSERDQEMLDAHERDGVPLSAIAQRYGVSGAVASLRIRSARRRLAAKARHPLTGGGSGGAVSGGKTEPAMVTVAASRKVRTTQNDANTDLIDDAVLALLSLGLHGDGGPFPVWRAWKGFDWAALGRLHDKGMIHNPVGKAKSVVLTDEGYRCCQEAFDRLFVRALPGRRQTKK
jgi:hypothetical protein